MNMNKKQRRLLELEVTYCSQEQVGHKHGLWLKTPVSKWFVIEIFRENAISNHNKVKAKTNTDFALKKTKPLLLMPSLLVKFFF